MFLGRDFATSLIFWIETIELDTLNAIELNACYVNSSSIQTF